MQVHSAYPQRSQSTVCRSSLESKKVHSKREMRCSRSPSMAFNLWRVTEDLPNKKEETALEANEGQLSCEI